MTPEEYIKLKRHEDYPGGHLCYTVSEADALKAIEMARNEKTIPASNYGGTTGWICPKCGGVYSPTMTYCPNCNGIDLSKVTCKL